MTRHKNWFRQEPKEFKGKPLRSRKFAKRYLFDADFRELDLDGALFDEAMLEGARFDESSLAQASIRNAHLAHAKFRNTDLTNADLSYDRDYPRKKNSCFYADFSHSTMENANFSRSPLT